MLPAVALALALVLPLVALDPAPALDALQDDAGSGRDAPDAAEGAATVLPGIIYQGRLTGLDTEDVYAFDATGGEVLELKVRGATACAWVHLPSGEPILPTRCHVTGQDDVLGHAYSWTLPASGTYHLRFVNQAMPAFYRFAFALDDVAPEPGQLDELEGADNDAGSRRDAPDAIGERPIFVAPGVEHGGAIDAVPGDAVDIYAFEARAGDAVSILARGAVMLCISVRDGAGVSLGQMCGNAATDTFLVPTTVIVPADGTYFLRVGGQGPQRYAFGFGVNAPAPEVAIPAQAVQGPNDADTRADAPNAPDASAPLVAAGRVHRGALTARPLDLADHYALDALAGQRLKVLARGAVVCYDVLAPSGETIAGQCGYAGVDGSDVDAEELAVDVALPSSGRYLIEVTGAGAYAFGFGLDAPAPRVPTPAEQAL